MHCSSDLGWGLGLRVRRALTSIFLIGLLLVPLGVSWAADGQDIEEGDQLWFLLAPTDNSGNAQWVTQTGGEALIFGG